MRVLLVVLALCGCAPASVTPVGGGARETVQRTMVLTSKSGAEITVLELAGDRALIRSVGAPCAGEGLVVEHQRDIFRNVLHYTTTVNGEPWSTLVRNLDSGAMLASPLGLQTVLPVTIDDTRSAAVDAQALLRLHREQAADGRLARLRRFDRAGRERLNTSAVQARLDDVAKLCGFSYKLEVSWKGVDDDTLLKRRSGVYACSDVINQLPLLCVHESPRAYFKKFDAVRCRYGAAVSARAVGRTLELTVTLESTLTQIERGVRALSQLRSDGKTLEARIELDRTYVCSSDKGRVIIVAPSGSAHHGVSTGDGKTFTTDGTEFRPAIGWFFDPRQTTAQNDPKRFYGRDPRHYSHVDADLQRGTCSLTCGDRVTALKLASRAQTEAIVDRAVYTPRPHQVAPYGLARDRAGIYTYVDRGTAKGRVRDFRVFRGPRGKVRLLKMKDIVSDSEGDIFSTQDGKLRLVMSKSEAQWITGARSQRLTLLPVAENCALIYNELGVYLGERLGLPCDDL
jgi:hypothetical protein